METSRLPELFGAEAEKKKAKSANDGANMASDVAGVVLEKEGTIGDVNSARDEGSGEEKKKKGKKTHPSSGDGSHDSPDPASSPPAHSREFAVPEGMQLAHTGATRVVNLLKTTGSTTQMLSESRMMLYEGVMSGRSWKGTPFGPIVCGDEVRCPDNLSLVGRMVGVLSSTNHVIWIVAKQEGGGIVEWRLPKNGSDTATAWARTPMTGIPCLTGPALAELVKEGMSRLLVNHSGQWVDEDSVGEKKAHSAQARHKDPVMVPESWLKEKEALVEALQAELKQKDFEIQKLMAEAKCHRAPAVTLEKKGVEHIAKEVKEAVSKHLEAELGKLVASAMESALQEFRQTTKTIKQTTQNLQTQLTLMQSVTNNLQSAQVHPPTPTTPTPASSFATPPSAAPGVPVPQQQFVPYYYMMQPSQNH